MVQVSSSSGSTSTPGSYFSSFTMAALVKSSGGKRHAAAAAAASIASSNHHHPPPTRVGLQTWIAILTSIGVMALFGIESLVYQRIVRVDIDIVGTTSAGDDHHGGLYRRSHHTSPVGHNHRKNYHGGDHRAVTDATVVDADGTPPTPRNGFVQRGSLSTADLREADHVLMQRRATAATAGRHHPRHPRHRNADPTYRERRVSSEANALNGGQRRDGQSERQQHASPSRPSSDHHQHDDGIDTDRTSATPSHDDASSSVFISISVPQSAIQTTQQTSSTSPPQLISSMTSHHRRTVRLDDRDLLHTLTVRRQSHRGDEDNTTGGSSSSMRGSSIAMPASPLSLPPLSFVDATASPQTLSTTHSDKSSARNTDLAASATARMVEPMTTTSNTGTTHQDDADHYSILDFERPYLEDCVPILQPTIHPTCNALHEMTLSTRDKAILSIQGSWRSAWSVAIPQEEWYHHYHKDDYFHKKNGLNTNVTTYVDTEIDDRIGNLTIGNGTNTTTPAAPPPPPLPHAVALKMLHFRREFNPQSYEAHATDIMVMDRLTASPYVVNAYAFCGQSVVTEYAPSSGRDYVKRYDIHSRDRLKIARDLIVGLADIQALHPNALRSYGEADSAFSRQDPVFAHNDINIANTVLVDGRVKWNDFNIGVLLRRRKQGRQQIAGGSNATDTKSSTQDGDIITTESSSSSAPSPRLGDLCPAPVKFRSDLWRSPEEIRNTSYVRLEQSDMYGLGNILYQTMTRHQPWTHKEPGGVLTAADVGERKRQGLVPTFPEQYRNTTKRELQVLFVSTRACYHPDPDQRPTIFQLAHGVATLYDKLKRKEKVTRGMILDYLVPNRR